MIKGDDLDNRGESPREPRGSDAVRADMKRVKGERATLADRLDRARALRPPATGLTEHCGHCWADGRDAAIRAIEGEGES
jgi:hypothetical protein